MSEISQMLVFSSCQGVGMNSCQGIDMRGGNSHPGVDMRGSLGMADTRGGSPGSGMADYGASQSRSWPTTNSGQGWG